jgi:hypothetical protein
MEDDDEDDVLDMDQGTFHSSSTILPSFLSSGISSGISSAPFPQSFSPYHVGQYSDADDGSLLGPIQILCPMSSLVTTTATLGSMTRWPTRRRSTRRSVARARSSFFKIELIGGSTFPF